MGSKKAMLRNGLGYLLREEVPRAGRFVDLFTGSGAVASFVAQELDIAVKAYDLQSFCAALARAIVTRMHVINPEPLWDLWLRRASTFLSDGGYTSLLTYKFPELGKFTQSSVAEMRTACAEEQTLPITKAYGGHYYSHAQALWLDALRDCLPENGPERSVALAALIQAASQVVAAPGHTAQPFQPTRSAKKFLYEAWQRDVVEKTKAALYDLCSQHARQIGTSEVRNANEAVEELQENDLVFIDPPYSGVHYSRFYHVLETISRGRCSDVFGVGRYPPASERPRSDYSISSESRDAISRLLKRVSERGATAVITFPDKKCSNGISSYLLRKLGEEYFSETSEKVVRGKFSTLGGDGEHRDARQPSAELVLVLRP